MPCRTPDCPRAGCVQIDGVWYRVTRQGLVMLPAAATPRKHPCRDCTACQWCSDARCHACRRRRRTGTTTTH